MHGRVREMNLYKVPWMKIITYGRENEINLYKVSWMILLIFLHGS